MQIIKFCLVAIMYGSPLLALADIKVFAVQGKPGWIKIVANNSSSFPYTVIASISGENIDVAGWPKAFVVNPKSQYVPGLARIINSDARANISIKSTYLPGDIRKQPATTVVQFPWRRGEEHIISQAYGSKLITHHDGINEQAIDIEMDVGTPVLAAKSGKVVEAIANRMPGQKVGEDKGGNSVAILHEDGSISVYAHLSEVKVKTEQNVVAGQLIALSGNTGASSGPHLHFAVSTVVFKDGTVKLRSIPIRFLIPGYAEPVQVKKDQIWKNGRT